MTDISMKCSPRIIIGPMSGLGSAVDGWGSRALLITDKVLEDRAGSIQLQLDSRGVSTIIFAREGLSPDTLSLDEVLSLARGSHADMIVALGGENVLSLGRLAAAVSRSSLHAGDLMERSKPGEPALPVLEIPSSGRYFLMFRKEAFLVDKVSSRAVLVSLPESLSGLVLVDSSIAGKMPVRVSSLSMASVFFAAVEAFLSPRSDFFSDVQSRSAVSKAAGLLRVVKEQSADPDYRIQEAEAAVLTAFATGLTGPGPGVILSRAVSAAAGVPKAATEAVLLPWVLESPLYSGSPKLKELSALIAESDENASEAPAEDIRALFGRLGFPGRLRELGAELADILPAAGWSVDMMETGRSDFDERTFRDILEFAS